MTLRVSLVIDGTAENAKKALAEVRTAIKQAGQEAKQLPGGNPFGPLDQGAKQATTTIGSTRATFKALAREAALVGGPMAGMIGQVGTLAIGTGRLGAAVTAGTVTIAALVATVYKAVTAFSELEQHQAKAANALAATHGASGQTIASLEGITRQLSKSGTQSAADIREAQQALFRFKAVGVESFEAVLTIARDVAATGFATLKDAAIDIAKAIAEPAKATEHLKNSNITLSVAQQRLATDFAATGQTAKSTKAILDGISTQFAGADTRAADTLGGAWGRLTKSSGTYFEQIGKEVSEATRLKDVIDGMATGLERYNKARAEGTAPGNPLTLPFRIGGAIGTRIGESIVGPAAPPKPKGAMAADEGGFITFGKQIESDDAAAKSKEAMKAAQKAKIDKVVDSLQDEARSAGLSATATKIYNEQVKAGVLNNAEFAAEAGNVAGAVNEIAAKGFMRQATEQFIAQTSALSAQAATAGMALGPAEAYRKEQEQLARAEAEGTKLSATRRAELKGQAIAYGTLADAAARAKINSDLSFERKTLFLSEEDVQIATRLRDLYANDIPGALASSEAAQMRLNYAVKGLKEVSTELTSSFAKDFRNELQNGAAGFEALRSAGSKALNTISDKLIDMASKKLWESALGGSGGGGLLGMLGISLGAGNSVGSVSAGSFGGTSGGLGGMYDEGGYTGNIGRQQIAGFVHGREFVMDADTTARHLPLLQAIHEGKLSGYADGGYVGVMPSLRSGAMASSGAPVVHIHPAAPGETFDARQNDDGSLALVGRMMDDKLKAFARNELPTRVSQINADPRAR